MVVLIAASTGLRVERALTWLLGQQLDGGGWNCKSVPTDTRHGSFHTSISALDALLAYRDSGGPIPVEGAMRRGQELLLDHRLYRSHRTGEVVSEEMTRFAFPPRWRFDVLRGLERFRSAGADRDPRLGTAVDVLRARRGQDGRRSVDSGMPGLAWSSRGPAAGRR